VPQSAKENSPQFWYRLQPGDNRLDVILTPDVKTGKAEHERERREQNEDEDSDHNYAAPAEKASWLRSLFHI
jgi:hypothetical protein